MELQRVQQRATRLMGEGGGGEKQGLTYKEWLRGLDMFTLEMKRLRGDMIIKNNILKSDSNNGTHSFMLRSHKCKHGHNVSLYESRFRLKGRKGLFTVRASRLGFGIPFQYSSISTKLGDI